MPRDYTRPSLAGLDASKVMVGERARAHVTKSPVKPQRKHRKQPPRGAQPLPSASAALYTRVSRASRREGRGSDPRRGFDAHGEHASVYGPRASHRNGGARGCCTSGFGRPIGSGASGDHRVAGGSGEG